MFDRILEINLLYFFIVRFPWNHFTARSRGLLRSPSRRFTSFCFRSSIIFSASGVAILMSGPNP